MMRWERFLMSALAIPLAVFTVAGAGASPSLDVEPSPSQLEEALEGSALETQTEEFQELHRKLVIHLKTRTLEVREGEGVLKQYPVGVGRPGFPTPSGTYKVISKVVNPAWENPYRPPGQMRIKAGKGNPLGTRWIGFKRDAKGEFGIHGTNRPQSVGKRSSHGCVRMYIKDAEELFELVEMNTPVEVTE